MVRCIICGRPIEDVVHPDEDDEDMRAKKPAVVCLRCQAKLKHEADDAQKVPKPI